MALGASCTLRSILPSMTRSSASGSSRPERDAESETGLSMRRRQRIESASGGEAEAVGSSPTERAILLPGELALARLHDAVGDGTLREEFAGLVLNADVGVDDLLAALEDAPFGEYVFADGAREVVHVHANG